MLAETVTRWTEQWLEEGRQEGERKGLQEGEQKGLQKAVVAMAKRGFAIAEIAQDLELSEVEVRSMLKSSGS